MKIKSIICAFLCVLLICTTAFATQSAEENTSADNTQQAALQPPQEEQIPADTDMSQDGNFGGRGFGGRGGGGRGMRPNMPMNGDAMDGDMGGNMQMPEQQMQENIPATDTTATQPNYFTHIAAAVLLVLGFLFVIFYKRRTF